MKNNHHAQARCSSTILVLLLGVVFSSCWLAFCFTAPRARVKPNTKSIVSQLVAIRLSLFVLLSNKQTHIHIPTNQPFIHNNIMPETKFNVEMPWYVVWVLN